MKLAVLADKCFAARISVCVSVCVCVCVCECVCECVCVCVCVFVQSCSMFVYSHEHLSSYCVYVECKDACSHSSLPFFVCIFLCVSACVRLCEKSITASPEQSRCRVDI